MERMENTERSLSELRANASTGQRHAERTEPKTREFLSPNLLEPVVRTTIKVATNRGDTRVEVESSDGFCVGDKVKIGTKFTEVRIVVGIGSLLLDRPLDYHHPPGTPVQRESTASRYSFGQRGVLGQFRG